MLPNIMSAVRFTYTKSIPSASFSFSGQAEPVELRKHAIIWISNYAGGSSYRNL
jgi:hypothetical protein